MLDPLLLSSDWNADPMEFAALGSGFPNDRTVSNEKVLGIPLIARFYGGARPTKD